MKFITNILKKKFGNFLQQKSKSAYKVLLFFDNILGRVAPLKEVQSFRQNSDIQIILTEVLTWMSMRIFFYYFELLREISNTQLGNDMS